jgi:TrpR-related protein YerC/YecD
MTNENIKSENTNNLFKGILALKTVGECYDFFEDLCTIQEIKALAQRLEVAQMLNGGALYTDIEQTTGASSATISRVSRCLNYGSGGYRIILERLKK